MEADLVARAGVPFTAIPAAGVHGVGLRALPGNLLRLAQGVFAARRILSEFKPDVIFFTGGFIGAPVAVAGRRYPILLYVPDIEPGLALRFLSRFARTIAITVEDSRRFFSGKAKTVVTGYPTRPELGAWDRAAARAHFNLSGDLPVLLVSGGSKGARTINQPVFQNLPAILGLVQVIHLTGSLDKPEADAARAALSVDLQARYHLYDYLHEDMGAALAAADLAITRAGASTLGEYPLAGLPAILVPYQFAWRYQKVNADYLKRQGAAEILAADQLANQLLPTLQAILGDPDRLLKMKLAMRSLAHPDAAGQIASLILGLAGKSSQGGKGDKSW